MARTAAADPLEDLLARAQSNGTVRVIVKIYAPDVLPEGALGHDRLGVELQRMTIADLQDILLDSLVGLSYQVLWRYATSPYVALEVSAPTLEVLATSLLVEAIVEDFEMTPRLAQSGPLVQATAAASLGVTGVGQSVVIVDDGVDRNHPFFAGRIVDEWCLVTVGSGCPGGSHGAGAAAPAGSHGTHVAGIAAGAGASYSGVAPGAGIIAIKVFPTSGGASFADVKAALDRALVLKDTMTIASVNMSLGATGFVSSSSCDASDAPVGLKSDIDALRAAGIATVVAAGNDSSTTSIGYPACISSAIKVGATTKSDTIAFYSDRAPSQEASTLLAPGGDASSTGAGNICSSRPASYATSRGDCPGSGIGGAYGYEAGTSMATPHVTGAWAVLKQAKPTATVSEVLAALRSAARLITDSNGTTYRRIQVRDAIGALTGLSVSIAPDRSSPQPANTTVGFTALSSGGVGTISYKWRVFDGATWTTARDWSTTPAFAWTPSVAGVTYTISVWARSATVTGDGADGTAATATMSFVILNPAPTLTALSPSSVAAGSSGFTLVVIGTSFTPSSVIRWNGASRTTTYVNPTQLRATITAADVANGGSVSLSVFNGAPGGGTSSTMTFTISGFNLTPTQLAYAKSYALATWSNYKTWDSLPQYLKDAAMEVASTTPATGSAPAPASTTGGALTAGQLSAAQAYALQNWPNYKSWDTLPQYLKDDAMAYGATTPATGGAAPSGGTSGGGATTAAQLSAAQAYALQNWPNYKTWDALPQYLKDAALDAAGASGGSASSGGASSGSSSSGGASAAAMAYALATWPNYKTWDSLPQYLKDAAIAATQ